MQRKEELHTQAMAVWLSVNSKEAQKSFSKCQEKKPAIAKRILGLSLQQLKNRSQKSLSLKESQKKHEYQS